MTQLVSSMIPSLCRGDYVRELVGRWGLYGQKLTAGERKDKGRVVYGQKLTAGEWNDKGLVVYGEKLTAGERKDKGRVVYGQKH